MFMNGDELLQSCFNFTEAIYNIEAYEECSWYALQIHVAYFLNYSTT